MVDRHTLACRLPGTHTVDAGFPRCTVLEFPGNKPAYKDVNNGHSWRSYLVMLITRYGYRSLVSRNSKKRPGYQGAV